jgi:hypothetical protein
MLHEPGAPVSKVWKRALRFFQALENIEHRISNCEVAPRQP